MMMKSVVYFSTDESATEAILKSQQIYVSLCGHLGMSTPRDAFITALCKASLPPHYTLTVLNTANPPSTLQRGKCSETFERYVHPWTRCEKVFTSQRSFLNVLGKMALSIVFTIVGVHISKVFVLECFTADNSQNYHQGS